LRTCPTAQKLLQTCYNGLARSKETVMTDLKSTLWVALATFLLSAGGSQAALISVANASFETLPGGGLPSGCGAGCSFSNDDPIPGWNSVGSFGQFQPGVQVSDFTFFNSVPAGITVAYSNGGTIEQTVGILAQAGLTYTLQVDVGFRKDVGDPGSVTLSVRPEGS
jgi:opacity protein-like surface antigen